MFRPEPTYTIFLISQSEILQKTGSDHPDADLQPWFPQL